MKLLLISDHENSFLWDYYVPGRLDGIDPVSYTHLTLPTT